MIGGPHPADGLGADPADRADMAAPALVGWADEDVVDPRGGRLSASHGDGATAHIAQATRRVLSHGNYARPRTTAAGRSDPARAVLNRGP